MAGVSPPVKAVVDRGAGRGPVRFGRATTAWKASHPTSVESTEVGESEVCAAGHTGWSECDITIADQALKGIVTSGIRT